MSQPVWVLSVDLQTKTATFQTGLADAARAARGAFNDIRDGAGEMGGSVNYSMMEARHSVMILGEEFGVHLPRALTSFIASIGPVGAALEAAFPFLAIALGATLLIEHLAKLHEAGEKLTADQMNFGTVANNAFNALDEKLIQAQIKSDELKNDHLGALALQLELIDKQSMTELVHQFEELDKAALTVMKDLEGHWYSFGQGSDGAKHALNEFKDKYDNLLSQGTDAGKAQASNLLAGTLKTAQDVLKAQQTIKANRDNGGGQTDENFAAEQLLQAHKVSLAVTKDEIKAQEQLVSVLQSQEGIDSRISKLKDLDSGNAKKSEANDEASRRSAAAREAAASQARMGEESVAADKASSDALLQIHRASIEARLASDIDFAGRNRDIKEAANQADIAGLDRSGKDYANQLQALNDKNLEIQQEYSTKVAELKSKASIEANARDITNLEQSERQQIESTQQGSAARLAVIESAIRAEQAANLQDTSYYRDLLNQRVQVAREMAEEEGKQREQAAKEDAANTTRVGALALAALKQDQALENSLRNTSTQQRIAQETQASDLEYAIKMVALQKEISGLDKSGKDYLNKLKALQDQERELLQSHEQELAQIKQKATQESNQGITSSYQQMVQMTSAQLTQSIMGHQTWGKMLTNIGNQMISGMLQNAIKSMAILDMDKEKQAADAARAGYVAGMKLPFPANVIAAPVMAAGAFASVMAFNSGTDGVPGVGRGDIIPALLEPGEGVIPGGVMDGLRNMARNGGFQQQQHVTHIHVRPTYHVNTIDGDGMQATLNKHSDQLQRHFEKTLRKMNR